MDNLPAVGPGGTAAGTALLLGLLRPTIYLPYRMDAEQCSCVLAHENAHIRRGDHWAKFAAFLLLSVYWFQPLLWIAYILFCQDVEVACDEKVIGGLSREERKRYSSALVSCSIQGHIIAACPLPFGEIGVKERVKNVLNYKKPSFWITLIAVAACIVTAVCFLSDPVVKEPDALAWAQSLKAEDVAEIRGYSLQQYGGQKESRHYSGEDMEKTVELINSASGEYERNGIRMADWGCQLEVTMKDGTKHIVRDEGDLKLEIDGNYYLVDRKWFERWHEVTDMEPGRMSYSYSGSQEVLKEIARRSAELDEKNKKYYGALLEAMEHPEDFPQMTTEEFLKAVSKCNAETPLTLPEGKMVADCAYIIDGCFVYFPYQQMFGDQVYTVCWLMYFENGEPVAGIGNYWDYADFIREHSK